VVRGLLATVPYVALLDLPGAVAVGDLEFPNDLVRLTEPELPTTVGAGRRSMRWPPTSVSTSTVCDRQTCEEASVSADR
jgi:hypothetical protein